MDKSLLNHIESILSWGFLSGSRPISSQPEDPTRPQSVSAAGVRLEGHRLGTEFDNGHWIGNKSENHHRKPVTMFPINS